VTVNYEIFIDDHSCRDTVTLSIYRVSYNRFVVVFEHCLAMTESWKNVLGCGERSWRVGEWALRCYWQHSLFNFVGWASLFSAVCVCDSWQLHVSTAGIIEDCPLRCCQTVYDAQTSVKTAALSTHQLDS